MKRRITGMFLNAISNTPFQFSAYKSYWNYKLSKPAKKGFVSGKQHYIAQKPNYGAGIGHQLANWNAGYYFSKFYHLQFAHFPFSNSKWEHFLGFGEEETDANALLKDSNFKKVKLPRFDSSSKENVVLIGNIIQSYKNTKVLFLLEQDQAYMRQCDTALDISEKFFRSPARKENKLLYAGGNFNIAVHIRRGDIVALKQASDSQGKQRWLDNHYYVNVLTQVLSVIPEDKNIALYLFSQGAKEDFTEFSSFSNLHYCLDLSAYDSFLHMVYADVLISSKSSFSYKPALISKCIKICPGNFWHAYPQTSDFILADDDGIFEKKKLAEAFEKKFISQSNIDAVRWNFYG